MRQIIVIILLISISFPALSQKYVQGEDISALYASTKQINQFIRRFNGEEDLRGKRLYPKDKKYRNISLRKKYLKNLFDIQNYNISSNLKTEFINDLTKSGHPLYYDFYGDNWFAELNTKFLYNGKEENVILYLKIEKETGGYKWSIINVYWYAYDKLFYQKPAPAIKFIHPMSHELDFMNLHKIFERYPDQIEYYTDNNFKPDYLSLFLVDLKQGKFKFQAVTDLKFHVFQISNWYFEIQNFNRKGDNSGWLISNLMKVPDKDKPSLIKLIKHD